MPRIVFISDTHLRHNFEVPSGDILIHAGDLTGRGSISNNEVALALDWFSSLPHKHKIFIAGNHDWLFEKNPKEARELIPKNVIYLQDKEVTVEGLRIYGSPWTPEFMEWAFNLPRAEGDLQEKWAQIPLGIDILVTHGPPLGILDKTRDTYQRPGQNVGCYDLRERIKIVKPRVHVFGHVHGQNGMATIEGTTFINAAICDEGYKESQGPISIFMD
jgi:Icc-related predicted phosphoesterase